MAKSWCTAPSDPVVRQIAEKYNLDKKDAMRIFNNAKANDPLCRDPKATLEFLEQQQGFKDALDVYTKDYIEAEDAIFDTPAYEKEQKQKKNDLRKEIEKELGIGLTEDEIDDIIDRVSNINAEVSANKILSTRLVKLTKAFPDARRLNFIGNYIAFDFETGLDHIERDSALRDKLGLIYSNTRVGYLAQQTAVDALMRSTKNKLKKAQARCEAKGKTALAKELQTAIDYYRYLLYMYGSKIMRDEGVQVSPEGEIIISKEDADAINWTDSDEMNGDIDGENITTDYDTSDNNTSVQSKMSEEFRRFVGHISSGNDPYGYTLRTPVSVNYIVNQLLTLCRGCHSYSEMIAKLKNASSSISWIKTILDKLESDVNLPQAKREQLKTQMYLSLHKSFTVTRKTFWWNRSKNGVPMATKVLNTNSAYDKMYNKLKGKLSRMAGARMFSGIQMSSSRIDAIRKEAVTKPEIDSIHRKAMEIVQKHKAGDTTASLDALTKELHGLVERMRQTLSDLAIDVPQTIMTGFLTRENEYKAYGLANQGWDEATALGTEIINAQQLVMYISDIADMFYLWSDRDPNNALNQQHNELPWKNPLANFRRRDETDENAPLSSRLQQAVSKFLTALTSSGADSTESSYWDGEKRIYSWGNPVTAIEILEKLTQPGGEKNEWKRERYIDRKYGRDDFWFKGANGYYAHWLNDFDKNNPNDWQEWIPRYSEKTSFLGKGYYAMTDADTALSMLMDFFVPENSASGSQFYANFRMPIASDKKKYATIRYKIMSRKEAVSQAEDFFAQELLRASNVVLYAVHNPTGTKFKDYDIQEKGKAKDVLEKIRRGERITREDVLDNGQYIFRNTGASFYLNKFLNSEIEKGTQLGEYIIDRIFNSKGGEEVVTKDILPVFRNALHNEVLAEVDRQFTKMLNSGLLMESEKLGKNGQYYARMLGAVEPYLHGSMYTSQGWHVEEENGDRNYDEVRSEVEAEVLAHEKLQSGGDVKFNEKDENYLDTLTRLKLNLYSYVLNNRMAKGNMMEIFNGDPAFYGNTTNYQKRNAQEVATGISPDPDATIHGEKVSDGLYRSITLKTVKLTSRSIDNLSALFDNVESSISDKKARAAFRRDANSGLEGLKKFDATDGQAFTTLTGLRKRLAGLGVWTRSEIEEDDEAGYVIRNGKKTYIMTDEAIYRRMRRGEPIAEDWLHIFSQPQKPFVSGLTHMHREGRGFNNTITAPVQYKNSEYALSFLMTYAASKSPNSQLSAIFKFVEETADNDPQKGIDSINWDSAQKVGENSDSIDIDGLSPQETYEVLQKAVYGNNPQRNDKGQITSPYKEGVVTEYDVSDYRIVQQKPSHFRDAYQQIGSQAKIISASNTADNADCILPRSGEHITGKELKRRYFDALTRKSEKAVRDFARETGLNLSRTGRTHRLSRMLMRSIMSSDRYDSDMRRGLSLKNKNGQDMFTLPLDDTASQHDVEAMLLSKIRNIFYRQKTRGGIVVQATSYAKAGDLDVRFYSSNPEDAKYGGVVPTFKQYQAEHKEASRQEYNDYLKKYQQGYAWFECETPMPKYVRDVIDKKTGGKYAEAGLIDEEGYWDMEKVKELVPNLNLDAICYRIPTEAKYSMMRCKVVRFSPEGGGDVARYPLELTFFTGSDFDIDTDFIELRPDPGTKDSDIDNEIFDLQIASLTSQGAVAETFHKGDFDDLKQQSYENTLLQNGYPQEQIKSMSPSEIKDKCMEIEDLDICDPTTDIILHNQNSDAKDMIAIAAVQNISHCFMTLYNSVDKNDESRNPDIHPENFLQIKVKNKKYAFSVIDDENGSEQTTVLNIGTGEKGLWCPLDMVYDMDGNLISLEIGKYIGASADAAKDAALYRLNINKMTLPILTMLHRLGVSGNVARMLIAHPVVRDLVRDLQAQGRTSITSAAVLKYIKGDTSKSYSQEEETEEQDTDEGDSKEEKSLYTGPLELRYSELADIKRFLDAKSQGKELSADDENYKNKLLMIIASVADMQNTVRNLDGFTRYNSTKSMKGSSFLDRYAIRESLVTLSASLDSKSTRLNLPKNVGINDKWSLDEFGRLCSMFPHIAETISSESDLVSDVILDYMKTYSQAFMTMADRLNNIRTDNTPSEITRITKKLYAGWRHYLMFYSGIGIANFNDDNVFNKYVLKFADYYNQKMSEFEDDPELKTLITNNSFIDSLYPDESVTYTAEDGSSISIPLIHSTTSGLSGEEIEKYKSDWAALLNNPKTKQFAIDMAIHFMAQGTSDSGYNAQASTHLMPLSLKQAIPGYIDMFENAGDLMLSDDEMDKFLTAFQMNSTGDAKLFPFLSDRTAALSLEDDGTGVLELDKDVFEKLTLGDGASYRMPVVKYLGPDKNSYYLLLGEPSINDDENAESDFKIAVRLLDKAGIEGKLLDYSYESVIRTHRIDPSAGVQVEDLSDNAAAETQGMMSPEESEYAEMKKALVVETEPGRRLGNAFTSFPYGDETFDEAYSKMLARNAYDMHDNPYLESRLFQKRANKLADIFGLELKPSRQMDSSGRYLYSFKVESKGGAATAGDRTAELFTVMSALNGGESTMKTYVSDVADADSVELSVPINTRDIKTVSDMVKTVLKSMGSNLEWTVDADRHEVLFTADLDNATKLRNDIAVVKSVISELTKMGLSKATSVEANLISSEYTNTDEMKDSLITILNGYTNESEKRQADTGSARRNASEYAQRDTRDEIRVSDITKLAADYLAGEASEADVRQALGEWRQPLSTQSMQGSRLVDDVMKNLDRDIMSEIEDTAESLDESEAQDYKLVKNLIINTANWIIGNRSQNQILSAFNASGISTETGAAVIETINKELKDKNIC